MKFSNLIEIAGTRAVSRAKFLYPVARSVIGVSDSARLSKIARQKSPVFVVYSQGRVGSTAIYNALLKSDLGMPLFHLHTLSSSGADEMIANHRRKGQVVERNHLLSRKIARVFEELDPEADHSQRWKVLSIFRDPLAIMLSLKMKHATQDLRMFEEGSNSTADFDPMVSHVRASFEKDDPYNWEVARWMDTVLPSELGLDPFSEPFDHSKGYQIIQSGRFDLAILKFENMAKNFRACVEDLVGHEVPDLKLVYDNVHRDRQFDEAHKYLKENLKLPRAFCERMYSTPVSEKLYSEEDRLALIKKWSD
ncbi:MAG: putative capsular polysaccharide synthesis family protein [Pseudomonadota bacterium]